MASTVLDFLYVHLADSPSTFLSFDVDAESATYSKPGKVEVGANGRRRAIFEAGADLDVTFSLEQVDREDYKTLQEWIGSGRTLLFRDSRERAFWGVIFDVSATEGWPDTLSFSISARQITYSEEV